MVITNHGFNEQFFAGHREFVITKFDYSWNSGKKLAQFQAMLV